MGAITSGWGLSSQAATERLARTNRAARFLIVDLRVGASNSISALAVSVVGWASSRACARRRGHENWG